LRGVQGEEAGEEAFEGLLEFIRCKNLAAAEGLENRRDSILAFHRLDVPATLNVTFLSTNHIENVMRNSRGKLGKVCRWNRPFPARECIRSLQGRSDSPIECPSASPLRF
jgi:hypothetical protein